MEEPGRHTLDSDTPSFTGSPRFTIVTGPLTRTVHVGSINLASTLGFLAMFRNDPTNRLGSTSFARATFTPEGAATIGLDWSSDPSVAEVSTWGDGAQWMLNRAERLLGLEDDVSTFNPPEGRVRHVWERTSRRRLAQTGTLWHDLAWFIIQQRVRTVDASAQWTRFVTALGEPAPGPLELTLPPSPAVTRATPYFDFHPFGIERQRADNLREAARIVNRFADAVDQPPDETLRKLGTVRGIGPWTLSNLAGTTWGDADAVIVGDAGIPHTVTWFLADEPWGTDERMLELLEPFRPHRARIIHLAFASGRKPPRRAPTPYGNNPIRRR